MKSALLASVLIVGTASAQESDAIWRIRVDAAAIDPSGALMTSVGSNSANDSLTTGYGGGLRAEYRLSYLLGIEAGILGTRSIGLPARTATAPVTAPVKVGSFAPVFVGLNFHLTPEHPADYYIGIQVTWSRFGSVDFIASDGALTSVSVDNDVGWGLILGADLPLGADGWLLQANLRYIDTKIKGSAGGTSVRSDFDPFIVSVGFGYRF